MHSELEPCALRYPKFNGNHRRGNKNLHSVKLVLATTWQNRRPCWKLRTRNFSPFNLRIQMYGVRSSKCDHLRNVNCGHHRSAQSVDSIWESDYIHQIERRPLFRPSTYFFRMHSERAIIAWASSAVAHVGTRQTAIYIIADVNSPQGYSHNFILKHFAIEPNQANETTCERGELIPSVFCGRNYQVRLNLQAN